MPCCSARTKRKLKKEVRLHKQRSKIDYALQEKINCTVICGGCKDSFRFDSFELKIHCNLCEQFFHCKVAGPCRGPACQIEEESGVKQDIVIVVLIKCMIMVMYYVKNVL